MCVCVVVGGGAQIVYIILTIIFVYSSPRFETATVVMHSESVNQTGYCVCVCACACVCEVKPAVVCRTMDKRLGLLVV